MRRLLITLTVALVSLSVYAGWERTPGNASKPGKTVWTDRPTEVSLFRRTAQTEDVYPAKWIAVYDNSVKYMLSQNSQTNNTSFVGTGLFYLDADDDVVPITVTQSMYDNRKDGQGRQDIEWTLDSDLDVMPKY